MNGYFIYVGKNKPGYIELDILPRTERIGFSNFEKLLWQTGLFTLSVVASLASYVPANYD